MNKETLELLQEALELGLNKLFPKNDIVNEYKKDYIKSLFLSTYKLVEFPESQQYMDESWFRQECFLHNAFDDQVYLDSAYFIPLKRILEYENKENN